MFEKTINDLFFINIYIAIAIINKVIETAKSKKHLVIS